MKIQFREDEFKPDTLEAALKLHGMFKDFFNRVKCEGVLRITTRNLSFGYKVRDIDILVMLEIGPNGFIPLSHGGQEARLVGGYIFVIEVKSHSDFEVSNGDIFVKRDGDKPDNASQQVIEARNNLINFLQKNNYSRLPLIADVVYLPNSSRQTSKLRFHHAGGIPPNFWDFETGAESILSLTTGLFSENMKYNRQWNSENVARVMEFLEGIKTLPEEQVMKFELLTISSFQDIDGKIESGQESVVAIEGAPGTGKTILMLGKAIKMARDNMRSLFLTYNKQLVLDLERLQDLLRDFAPKNPIFLLQFETWDSMLTKIYSFNDYGDPLGSPPPDQGLKVNRIIKRYGNEKGKRLFELDETRMSRNVFKYHSVGFVFVDEAQDLTADIFSILKTLFGANICISIGNNQEFSSTFQPTDTERIVLREVRRQKEVPSNITRKFLVKTGIKEEYKVVHPLPPQLAGGRSVVLTSELNDTVYDSIFGWLKSKGLKPYDLMHLHNREGDAKAKSEKPHYHGGMFPEIKTMKPEKFRYYHYQSCRGLEANVVIFEEIDKYYEWCKDLFGTEGANKRLFIALSRVKDFAIFTFKDFNHWLFRELIAELSVFRDKLEVD